MKDFIKKFFMIFFKKKKEKKIPPSIDAICQKRFDKMKEKNSDFPMYMQF